MADRIAFESLLARVSASWEACDAAAASRCFAQDAVYMEPPDRQLFIGREQLLSYFSPLVPGTYLDIHAVWFDEATQTGAFEFTFGDRSADAADHGVVVVALTDDLISSWREYHRKGLSSFDHFIAVEGKNWEWHAGNYP